VDGVVRPKLLDDFGIARFAQGEVQGRLLERDDRVAQHIAEHRHDRDRIRAKGHVLGAVQGILGRLQEQRGVHIIGQPFRFGHGLAGLDHLFLNARQQIKHRLPFFVGARHGNRERRPVLRTRRNHRHDQRHRQDNCKQSRQPLYHFNVSPYRKNMPTAC